MIVIQVEPFRTAQGTKRNAFFVPERFFISFKAMLQLFVRYFQFLEIREIEHVSRV
jgi:hypothetical protein